jgi:hypothetical protein
MSGARKVIITWVNPTTGAQSTPPLPVSEAQNLAAELQRRFPAVYETLTIKDAP